MVPDIKYNDLLVARFVNAIMLDGKKTTAQRIVYDAFDIIAEKTKDEPLDIFKKALAAVAPVMEVRSRRVGGATYQVPVDVREDRRVALSVRWIKNFARSRREKTMAERVAGELMSAAKGEGSSVKKKEDTHRMAEANRAFAHFKW